jgi:hypothetical protein
MYLNVLDDAVRKQIFDRHTSAYEQSSISNVEKG